MEQCGLERGNVALLCRIWWRRLRPSSQKCSGTFFAAGRVQRYTVQAIPHRHLQACCYLKLLLEVWTVLGCFAVRPVVALWHAGYYRHPPPPYRRPPPYYHGPLLRTPVKCCLSLRRLLSQANGSRSCDSRSCLTSHDLSIPNSLPLVV